MAKQERKNKTFNARIWPQTPDDEIVISGISGKFPSSKNVTEFAHNLYNKIDMVKESEERWIKHNAEIPTRMGVIKDIGKFDATFFGVPYKQTNSMDPQSRLLIETAYEAIIDAGVCPKSIRGSKTGVFIGACFCETEKTFFYEQITPSGLGITGCSRAMLANRISYCLGLTGPSFLLDTACSSSMYALDAAFTALRTGECDAALVGGSNLLLYPYTTLQFARLGVLAKDGFCRPFDYNASGYTRSEAVCVIYLQRAKDAKRIYANVVYSKCNCDGFKQEGITYPSGSMQQQLLSEFYDDVKIDPRTLSYVEAHSTGTVVGDPEECRALDNIFCQDRKDPLIVGSVKSNIGHSESSSGACSIAKVILAFENNLIPPNINFERIRDTIPALAEKRMIVCNEPTPFTGNLIAINSFGFGGANAHVLLSKNSKEKINAGLPIDDLPRLVNWAGRTEESVNTMLDALEEQTLDAEYIGLLHNAQSEDTPGYLHRGYSVLAKNGNENAICLSRATKQSEVSKLPIIWIFTGMGSQWIGMGKSLLSFSQFRESIQLCHDTLKPFEIDLISVITSDEPSTFDYIVNSFCGIAAIQIGLVDLLRVLEIPSDYIIGHSVGELGCAYADGTLTAEQTILAAYSRGIVSYETKVIEGAMAAVGLGYENLMDNVPSSIEIACHNSFESSTISGPKADVAAFVANLKSQGIFAKEVQCSNIPYHSRYIVEMGQKLLKKMREIIPNPAKRSSKWLSSSVAQSEWGSQLSIYSSAEYHTNNLLSPVLFEETSKLLPSSAITIEVAPHGLLQAIVKRSMPDAIHIPLTNRGNANNAAFFLSALGKIFMYGYTFPIERLYPKVQFPVSRGTSMIAPLMRWDHTEDWFVMKFEVKGAGNSGERKVMLSFDEYGYIGGHIIDGRVIVPATVYLQLAWETMSMIATGSFISTINVEFEDVRFMRATSMNPGQKVELNIMIHYGNGQFEITENGHQVVSGIVRLIESRDLEEAEEMNQMPIFDSDLPILEKKEFYKELRLRGYHYQDLFQSVQRASGNGTYGIIKWQDNWSAFMDCMLQMNILANDSRSLYLPTRIRKIRVNSMKHTQMLSNLSDELGELVVTYNKDLKLIKCGGVEIYEMVANSISRRKPPGTEVLESYRFLPLVPSETLALTEGVRVVVQLVLENSNNTSKLKIAEVDSEMIDIYPIISFFEDAIAEIPLIKCELTFYTDQSNTNESLTVQNKQALAASKGYLLMVGYDCLTNKEVLEVVEENHFLLSRQPSSTTFTDTPNGFILITSFATEQEKFVLFKRKSEPSEYSPTVIEISSADSNYEWLDTIKLSIKSGPVLLVAQNDPNPGLLGLVNCIRREPNGENVRCVIVMDRFAPKFNLDNSLYSSQLELGLAINIYRSSMWGTYRFFKLEHFVKEISHLDHVYANVQRIGDLSSFQWFGGPLRNVDNLVNVHYASINFRDIMLATGRLPIEVCRSSRTDDDCVLGMEFSGVTMNGARVMGMVKSGAMASQIQPVNHLTWIIPKDLSLRDGATIPAVYITVYYAFFFYRSVVRGNSILIHAGSGGIGLAAIRVALAYGLEVYTTVSTQQKKKFIMGLFSQLKEENIGNSRDCSFEVMIMRRTKGRGVDFVLNSLSDEKLLASIRCLARGGTFLEIGKFDIMNNSALGMSAFQRETTFRAVFADNLIYMPEERKIIHELIDKDLRSGIIQPLHSTVFQVNEIEKSYRFMSTGKHVGKVMIQVRETEQSLATVPIKVHPKVYFNPNMAYIIAGGLGGFGLELSDWLVLRGARILVLNSRSGVTNSYQAFRIRLWESYGCKIIINTADIGTYQGCKILLIDSLVHGHIGGIFNLAAVLRDSILENQTIQHFQECVAPKALATRFLNELSRILCPHLEHFVVFSSVSCGMGNAGQSNYGMANSIMERIIEHRVQDKLPGKAIQWGAIGEVGLVAEMTGGKVDVEVAGTLQQRIESCLNVLDVLLTSPQPIVSSLVIADKVSHDGSQDGQLSLIKSVMKIMGFRDAKLISKNSTLAELGMDSLMSVELKQMFEREYDVLLTAQELRTITFAKLQEMSSTTSSDDKESSKNREDHMNRLFQNLGDEAVSDLTLLPINNIDNDSQRIVFIPGIEGIGGSVWHTLGANLKSPAKLVQLMKSRNELSLDAIADSVIQEITEFFSNQKKYCVVAHSYGTLIAIKIAYLLEKFGKCGHIILIDGSPNYLKRMAQGLLRTTKIEDSTDVLIMVVFSQFCRSEFRNNFIAKLSQFSDVEQKIDLVMEFLSTEIKDKYSVEYIKKLAVAIMNRLKVVIGLNLEDGKISDVMENKLKSPITLIRPTQASFTDIDEDYSLHRYTEQEVNIKYVEGNHLTVLENPELTDIINSLIIS